ncbi:MAG TPA: TIGR00159 family protein [Firmicutes bacterium]|nr:TIGR00159 family protein [Bacillota bacterium]
MPEFSTIDALDIIIVGYVVYRLMLLIRGTRATSIIKGLGILFVDNAVSRVAGLRTIAWILNQGTTVVLVALPIVFYPELRRALEHLGRGQLFSRLSPLGKEDVEDLIDTIVRTVRLLSKSHTGALIVFEREVGLEEYIESGVRIEGAVSTELLLNIFHPNTPLHDGAVIIRGNRVTAAGCFLPLTDKTALPSTLGTRHRAALGVAELSDALVLVVSEETGIVSLAMGTDLRRDLAENDLRQALAGMYEHAPTFLKGWAR